MLDPDRRHLLAYLAAAAVLVVIAVRFIGHAGAQPPIPTVSMAAPATGGAAGRPERPRPPASIWVDVAGQVRRPGLYALPPGSRVAAALQRAGGALPHAETTAVNLAAKLADGQQVVVPARGQASVTAGAGVGASPGSPGARISLSNAGPEQLEQLDGIGPALAQRIVEYRQAHGGFRSIDQLQEVSGIGAKRFQALRDRIEP